MSDNKTKKPSFFSKISAKALSLFNYFWVGVWQSDSDSKKVRAIKVLNLSVRSFFDRDLQAKSMALTYSTVLAIVPAFALLFAIGRGFGFQNIIEKELYQNFPAQKQMIDFILKFVDSYLKEASQGIFVGIGIIFLLWTLVSLLSNIEEVFNKIWNIRHDRTFYQKVTDYVAICLMVPVLMICSSGVSIFVSATMQENIHFPFLTPLVNFSLETMPFIFAWLAFSLSFCLIPNTKVEFKYAAISGAICAIVFQVLQLLFLNGTIYVSKYNAIYGSFAFLPLMLIWLQLSWLILLFGCVLTYALQNVLTFNFLGDFKTISENYERKVSVVIASVVVQRFRNGLPPMTAAELSSRYDIPYRVTRKIVDKMHSAKLVNIVLLDDDKRGIAPAQVTDTLSVGELFSRLDSVGGQNFIPRFSEIYKDLLSQIDNWLHNSYTTMDDILIREIHLPESGNSTAATTGK